MDQNQKSEQNKKFEIPSDKPIFEVAYDLIELPSKGLFYPHKKGKVKVAYLTAHDENILTSPNLLSSGNVLNVLLEKKILDSDIKADDLLVGDRNAILFFLRATGYGEMYPVKLIDPKTGLEFDYEIDLSKIQEKPINIVPDENGEVDFLLPKMQYKIKFKYLTASENARIVENEDARMKKTHSLVSNLMTTKLEHQITEVDGSRSRAEIIQLIETMPVSDASALRKFMAENEPGLNDIIEVPAPSGAVFRGEIPITSEFFWPYL